MLIAVPIWQGRVSPVFDVAGHLLVVEFDGDQQTARRQEVVTENDLEARARRIVDLGVNTLICGGISRSLESLLRAGRIEVIPRVCGNVEDVLEGYRLGALDDQRFVMPGCCGQRLRWRRGQCRRGKNAPNQQGKGAF